MGLFVLFLFLLSLSLCNVARSRSLRASHGKSAAQRVLEAGLGGDRHVPSCGFDARLMAECTEHTYRDSTDCGCWRKVISLHSLPEARPLVEASVFQHGNECLLGLSGQMNGKEWFSTDKFGYFMDQDPVLAEDLCGKRTVRGFATKAKLFFNHSDWAPLSAVLASGACSGGVTIAGSSMGGILGEILAGCANRGSLVELQGSSSRPFHVDGLYTFGTPPIATTPISNRLTNGSCFPGKRIFRASNVSTWGATDLVAFSTASIGYVHPLQDAVQLIELPNGSFETKLYPCASEETPYQPDWATVRPYLEKVWHDSRAVDFLSEVLDRTSTRHQLREYVKCLDKIEHTSDIEDRRLPSERLFDYSDDAFGVAAY